MTISIGELATHISGEVRGDPDRMVSGVAPFGEATGRDITLAAEAKLLKTWKNRCRLHHRAR